jgi:hypothetical protein
MSDTILKMATNVTYLAMLTNGIWFVFHNNELEQRVDQNNNASNVSKLRNLKSVKIEKMRKRISLGK